MPKSAKISDQEVKVDRRRDDRRAKTQADGTEFKPPRRKQQRRRQIDPTTCERDYNGDEILFMQALDAYKRSSGRMFPTCSEILEVVRGLGYVKLSEEEQELIASIAAVESDLAAATDGLDDDEAELEAAYGESSL
ncbi:hypothetical protein [Aureliella helgolandensis]|uniref:Uncharacterized protein n=1 Tax=Aureliella helgolandensis TaxID=2527968 RepID=A0A518GF77_9BACT|nr:hypothetical protein [Aureliella helgolandensis]QDV27208.1 hypothetical protein Q31a_55960 [Aureliella helgolandensis]